MTSFFDFLIPKNNGLDPQGQEYLDNQGLLGAASALAELSAPSYGPRPTVAQLLAGGLGGYQQGAQGALDQYNKNIQSQAAVRNAQVQDAYDRQNLDWFNSQNNNSFYPAVNTQPGMQKTTAKVPQMSDFYRKNNSLSVRNNNPGNMRASNGDFRTFATPDEGIAAMRGDLSAKISGKSPIMQQRYGAGYTPTLTNVISTWAPPTENDTQAYINFVSQKTGIDPNAPLTQNDIQKVQSAMTEMEGGQGASSYFASQGAPQSEGQDQSQRYYQLAEMQARAGRPGAESFMKMGQLLDPSLESSNAQSLPAAIQIANELQRARNNGDTKRVEDLMALTKARTQMDTSSPDFDAIVDLIGTGREKSSTVLSRMSPGDKQAVLAAVHDRYPDYTTNLVAGDARFSYGATGDKIRSLNVAISHLNDTLLPAIDALNNGDIQLFNELGNFYNTQTGEPEATNFEAAKQIVANEVIKAIVNSGGGVSDREDAQKMVDAANSPEQLNGAVSQIISLLGGQLHGFQQQYKATTGKENFNERFLTKQTQDALLKDDNAGKNNDGWSVRRVK